VSSFVFSLLLLVVFILRAFLSLRKPDICRRLEELKKEKFGESYDDFSDQDQVDDITEGPTKPIQVKIFTAEGITQINNASEEGDCTSGLVTNDVPTESP
jgi:hypothetical protein